MRRTINPKAFEEFPVLKSQRLTLRPILLEDAPEIFAMNTDDLVLKYIAKEKPTSIQEVEELINKISTAYEKQEMLCWAAILREGDKIIGTCGFNRFEKENLRAEIGGALSPRYWGCGVAQEAFEQIIAYGLGPLGLHSIEAKVDANNRSAKVLLERFGFVREGHFKDRYRFEDTFYAMDIYTRFATKKE